MKMFFLLLGILVIIAGALPFLQDGGILPAGFAVPTSGAVYQAIIVALGVLVVIAALKKKRSTLQ